MKKFFTLLLITALITPVFVMAADNPCSAGTTGTTNIPSCVNQVYIWSIAAAALLALFMIVIGGYITLTARGNAAQASKGKSYITSSLIGLVLLFGAYILLRTINPDLVDFNNNCINHLSECATTNTTTQNSTTPASAIPNSGTGLEGSPLDPGNTGCIYLCDPRN